MLPKAANFQKCLPPSLCSPWLQPHALQEGTAGWSSLAGILTNLNAAGAHKYYKGKLPVKSYKSSCATLHFPAVPLQWWLEGVPEHVTASDPSDIRKLVLAVHQVLHPYRDCHVRAGNLAQRGSRKGETVFYYSEKWVLDHSTLGRGGMFLSGCFSRERDQTKILRGSEGS